MSMPTYGGPGATPPKKKSNLPLIIAAIGVLGLAIAVVIVLMTKDDDPSAQPGPASSSSAPAVLGPKETVEAFMAAAAAGDGVEARKYTSDTIDEQIQDSGTGMDENQSYEVGEAQINGDQATVPVTLLSAEESTTGDLNLQKTAGGTWEITDVSSFD